MRIGLIADTHLPRSVRHLGELGPDVPAFFGTVDLILHAGDVVLPYVLDWLEQFAPVLCALGNNDHFEDERCRPRQFVEVEGWRIGMIHDLESAPRNLTAVDAIARHMYGRDDLDILVAGDSHYEVLDYREQRLILNPGSTPFPHHQELRLGSVGLLEVTRDGVHAEIVRLGDSPGAPNPCVPSHIAYERGRVLSASLGGRPLDPAALAALAAGGGPQPQRAP